jgi:hypothetical protein
MTRIALIIGLLALMAGSASAEPPGIRASVKRHATVAAESMLEKAAPAARSARVQATPRRGASTAAKIGWGALGALGGFFAGGYIGAAIDGECGGCDDPGLKGALIGAPIGAIVGAIAGVSLAR